MTADNHELSDFLDTMLRLCSLAGLKKEVDRFISGQTDALREKMEPAGGGDEAYAYKPYVYSPCRVVVKDRRCWFCMSDLARALRYSKPYDAAQFLCSKENMQKITVPHIQSDTRTMQMWFCNEHGFMEVVRKKVAKPDREKVLERVLDGRDFSEFLVW